MKRVICHLFGHKYRLLKIITPTIREVKCKRCGQEFGMNDAVRSLLPMDEELKTLHYDLKKDL